MLLYEELEPNAQIAYFDSQDIPYIKYRTDTKQMLVCFKKGHRLYLYSDVPRDKFLSIRNSESQNKALRDVMANRRDKELYNVQKLGSLSIEDIQTLNEKINI